MRAEPGPVDQAAADLTRCLAAAEDLTGDPDVTQPAMVTGGHPAAPSLPGNGQALAVVLDAHTGVRRLNAALTVHVTHQPPRRRGGSDANTAKAITEITHLSAGLPRPEAVKVARILDRMTAAAQRLAGLDEAVRWLVMRLEGTSRPPRCPYCTRPTLRLAEGRWLVMCFYPRCTDANGNRPVASLGIDARTAETVMYWRDRRVTAPQ